MYNPDIDRILDQVKTSWEQVVECNREDLRLSYYHDRDNNIFKDEALREQEEISKMLDVLVDLVNFEFAVTTIHDDVNIWVGEKYFSTIEPSKIKAYLKKLKRNMRDNRRTNREKRNKLECSFGNCNVSQNQDCKTDLQFTLNKEELYDFVLQEKLNLNLEEVVIENKFPQIDVVRIAEHLGYSVDFAYFCGDFYNIENKTIKVDLLRSEAHRRFAIAHELGHILLGHYESSSESKIHDIISERKANLFAMKILMPKKLIESEFSKLKDENDIRKINILAEKFNVSTIAVNHRLIRLGLK